MAFRGKPNIARVGRKQAATIERLSQGIIYGNYGYVPEELNLLMAVGTREGDVGPRYSVRMREDPASWTYKNDHPVLIGGMNGMVDKALFYHPAFDEAIMAMPLAMSVVVTPQDSVTFNEQSIVLSGDSVATFRWPREDYLIHELEEP